MRETLDRNDVVGAPANGAPTETTTREAALARIAVRPPYFGLGAMEHRGRGIVSAMVPASPPRVPERGPVAAAQVARHLAILGSCAAALERDDDTPHHYLATQAHYARLAGRSDEIIGGMLAAEAVASWVDKRTARALVKLMTADGEGLHLLDVTYSVLTEKVFARFNPAVEVADGGLDTSGAAPDRVVEVARGKVEADCGPIAREMCEGHFPGYPAAPVAIVMGQLCAAAGRALESQLDEPVDYRIEGGFVSAKKLAVAGQRLVLVASYVEPTAAGHLLVGTALADGEPVGEVSVTMSAFPDHGPGRGHNTGFAAGRRRSADAC